MEKLFNVEEPEETPAETTGDDALQAIAEALAEMDKRMTAIESKLESTEQTVEEVQEDVETVKEVVDTEEFARLKSSLPAILKNFGKLDTLATRVPSRNPKGNKNARFNFL